MPNRDGTGPDGKGSKTGRGMGNCATLKDSNLTRPKDGRDRGQGQGRGRGLARRSNNS